MDGSGHTDCLIISISSYYNFGLEKYKNDCIINMVLKSTNYGSTTNG